MPVTAAFYPLQFAAAAGRRRARCGSTSLTRPGVEPHDLELTPRAVGSLARSEAVVYLAGFQPAVDRGRAHAGRGCRGRRHARRPRSRRCDTGQRRPALLARPDPARRRRDGAGRATSPGSTPRTPPTTGANAARSRRDLDRLDQRVPRPAWPSAAPASSWSATRRSATSPQRYDLTGRHRRAEPRGRAVRRDAARPQAADRPSRRHDDLLREPGQPRARETRRQRGRRPASAVLDPLEGITDVHPGTTTLTVMRANLAALRAGPGVPMSRATAAGPPARRVLRLRRPARRQRHRPRRCSQGEVVAAARRPTGPASPRWSAASSG